MSIAACNQTADDGVGQYLQEIRSIPMLSEQEERELALCCAKGDEDAIETLTLEEMDMYTTISRRIHKEDVFSLVDTYFMPYGVECDQYSVLGEIENVHRTKNQITGEEIYVLTITCNELTFDVWPLPCNNQYFCYLQFCKAMPFQPVH